MDGSRDPHPGPPPAGEPLSRRKPQPACPHCGSTDVEIESAFGSSLMTSQFWCRGCRTVFEHVRWDAEGDPGGWLDQEMT